MVLEIFVILLNVNDVVKVLEEDTKFLKLLEVLGEYSDQGSIIIFVDKQEHADGLLKVVIILADLMEKPQLELIKSIKKVLRRKCEGYRK